jgi:MurNAc alpha-1-phosphate uridylyltransferase
MKLRPLLDDGIARAHHHRRTTRGRWVDVGTPERLAELDRELA